MTLSPKLTPAYANESTNKVVPGPPSPSEMALDPVPALLKLSPELVRLFRLSLDPCEATLDPSPALARLSGAPWASSEASLKPFGASSRASSRASPLPDLPLHRKVAESAGINCGDHMDCSGRGNNT